MSSRRLFRPALLIVLAALAVTSCRAEGFAKKRLSIRTAGGATVKIEAELARTDAERALGLMYRKSLADGKGMLFIFDADQMMSFWMKNTYIPLSIAYIAADGLILEIHDMEPQNTNPVHSARPVRYALEAPRGWFGRAGVAAGDVVDFPEWN